MQKNPSISEELVKEVRSIRRHIHKNPEPSGQEFATTQLIKEYLAAHKIKILEIPLKTGVIAEIGNQTKGPIIALRADIDALPIQEATNLAYASENPGVMHACGHDFHTASLLGAATLLKEQEAELNGKIRLIFQPAEEINQGGIAMVKAGAVNDVSAILGFHNKPDLPVGTFGIKSGPLMAAVDQFKVKIKGVGTHAAAPQNGSDPIVTACQIVSSLQAIVSRHVSPISPAVLSVTHIEGGNTWNVIPESVFLEGTIRTFFEADQQKIKQLFEETIQHVTSIYGQIGEIEWIAGPPVVMNNPELTEIVKETTATFASIVQPELTMGGEDFANYQREVPGFFAFIGTDSPFEWHHPSFTVDDSALPYAIQYYVENTKALLQKLE
ncbi:amidohydrolase [Enterococcus sp. LJL99]